MKSLIAAVALLLAAAPAKASPYFDTVFRDPAHPKISAALLYTPRFDFDGGVSDVAVIYHKGDPANTVWPKALLDMGIPPVSWSLLELGAGGNRQTGFVHFGTSVNVAPTLLGPLASGLKGLGGKAAVAGNLLVAPNGGGVKLSLGWKANAVEDGAIVRFNRLRFPPRYGVGYTYQF